MIFKSHNPHKYIGVSFSAVNLFFLLRMIWLLSHGEWGARTTLLLVGTAVICGVLFAAGLLELFLDLFRRIYSLPGSIIIIFGAFVVLKKGLKLLLSSQNASIRTEIGTWFIALFLWAAGAFLVTFIRKLVGDSWQARTNGITWNTRSRMMLAGFLLISGLLVGYWTYTQIITPLPTYANYDPEYIYMLNSGTPLIDLELYKRLDHPGTLMQLLGTGIIMLTSPLSLFDGTYPYQYLVIHPGTFLICARLLLLILNLSVLYLLYQEFKEPEDWPSVLAGISVLLAYFALHNQALKFLTIWSPNAFNFSVGSGLLFLTYKILTNDRQNRKLLWMLSVALGIGATFHVYMVSFTIPLVVAVFLIRLSEGKAFFTSATEAARYIVGSISGYFIGTMIILPYYRSYFEWIKSVVIHTGSYGTGEVGITSLRILIRNFQGLFTRNTNLIIFLAILFTISLILLITNRKQLTKEIPIWALFAGLYLQLTALFLIVSKHPVNRYLLSATAVVPMLLILIHKVKGIPKMYSGIFFGTTAIALGALLSISLYDTIQEHHFTDNYLTAYQDEVRDFQDSYSQELQDGSRDLVLYWSYGTYSPCYSLWFGNDFSKRLYTSHILESCPAELQYDVWDETITGTNDTGLDALFRGHQNRVLVANTNTIEELQDEDHTRVISTNLDNLGFIVYQDTP